MSRLAHVIHKEFIQIRRDSMMPRLILIMPIFQLIMFGYAATNDVRNVAVAVFDGDRSADSRRIVQAIESSYYFHLVAAEDDPRSFEDLILRGRAQIGVHIPRDFHRTIMRGETAQIGVLVDGSDSNTAGVATAYLTGILKSKALEFQIRSARSKGAFRREFPQLVAEPRVWYNVDLRSVNYMVPGVIGLILLVLTISLASLAIVRERERGTLEQLMVTPLRSRELIFGKVIPFGILAGLDVALIFLITIGWFQVPFRGSLALLSVMAVVFLVSNLGLGLLVSALSRTQQEAQILAFLIIMPSVLLSGFMFPIENMPTFIQYITYLIPFRYFLQIVRGVFLKGSGVSVLWPQIVTLTGMAVALIVAGIVSFRKHL